MSTAEATAILAELAKVQAVLSEVLTGQQALKEQVVALTARIVADGASSEAKAPRAKKAVNKEAPTVAVSVDGAADGAAVEEKKDEPKKPKPKASITKPAYITAHWQTEPLNAAIQKELVEKYAAAVASGTDAEKGKKLAAELKAGGQKKVLEGIDWAKPVA